MPARPGERACHGRPRHVGITRRSLPVVFENLMLPRSPLNCAIAAGCTLLTVE